MSEEKRFAITPHSREVFEEVARPVAASYQRIVRLMEEDVLSNDEFDFWTEATLALVEALKKLDALAKRA